MPLRILCTRLLLNVLSTSVAEYEVGCIGLEMRGRKVCENKLLKNCCVGT